MNLAKNLDLSDKEANIFIIITSALGDRIAITPHWEWDGTEEEIQRAATHNAIDLAEKWGCPVEVQIIDNRSTRE